MIDSTRQRFERLEMRLAELDATLADPALARQMSRYRAVTREHVLASRRTLSGAGV